MRELPRCVLPRPSYPGRKSGVAHDDAIGVLALDEKGELKPDKVGKPSAGKGAGIGAVAALVTPVALVAGLLGGGLLGSLHHMNLGLGKAERARPGSELEGGKAAVGVLVPLADASFMVEKLASMGGAPETHQVSADAVAEPTKAATAPTEPAYSWLAQLLLLLMGIMSASDER